MEVTNGSRLEQRATAMKLTIHRGAHEIGGSCVELATPAARIVLDVGVPLVDASREPFDPRSIRDKTVEELIADGTLPGVPGLFDDSPPPDAIILSHAHLDHAGLLHYSKSEVPIYASKGTSKMMLAAGIFAGQTELDRTRRREIQSGRTYPVGDFQVTPYDVDHSAFGSMAFLVEADGKNVLYSGDLRLHGRKPGMTKSLIEGAGNRRIDALLMEGTHFGSAREQGITEYELEDQIVGHVQTAPGVVLAAFSPIDVDRIVTYYKAARRTGRIFVADVYTAFVLHLVASQAGVPRPTRTAGIAVYYNRSFESSYERRNRQYIHQLFTGDRITLDDIRGDPDHYLMVFRPSMTGLDFGGALPSRSRCLYSYWTGYLNKPEWVELQEQLAAVGGDFIRAHTSGHIYIRDALSFVHAINPWMVIPIHTFEPEEFRKHFATARLLEDGQALTL